ncbi:hypothetical protein RclHR1_09120001, partial [Rhizophagus clarus]
MNDAFRNGQLSIFIYPQYQVGISSSTHMSDLNSLIQDNRFDGILKINSQIKPIWILLVDGEPNKNLRHIKNIFQYCGMFCNFNLDYLSIWTHAPGQSTYNPVKRSITGQNRCYQVHIRYISATRYVPDMCEICVCYLIILHISGT